MNKNKIRRLIASVATFGFTAVSLVTSTFAFVNLNTEAKVAEFGFSIKNQEGLLISTDGVNFSQDLNYTQITEAIKKYYNEDLAADKKITDYSELSFLPVTLAKDSASDKVEYSQYQYMIGNTGVNLTDYRANFLKDSIVLADDTYKTAVGATDNDIFYKHELVNAESTNYIFIDLWFTIANLGDEHSAYDLSMSDRTSISGESKFVELKNNLTTTGSEDLRTGTRADGAHKDEAYVKGSYLSGDVIEVNAADAMRLAVVTPATASNPTPTIKVYEPSIGLGSYAFDKTDADVIAANLADDNHDSAKNAAYTYYNSLNPLSPFTDYNGDYATYFEGTKTLSEFNDDNDTYGKFVYDSTNNRYNTIKLSVMIWLEGWDADYIMGISAQDVNIKLGFEVKKSN